MYAFDLKRPTTLAEAAELASGDEAQLLAGGQTLIPTLKQRLAAPDVLISLTGIAELQGVCLDDAGRVCIGAATSHADVARDAAGHYPALAATAGQIGDPAVRNRGTIGGSLANNDPSACYPAAILASDAVILTQSREIPAEEFFEGLFTTALDEGEIITEIRARIPERAHYAKIPQPASRFAMVGAFVAKYADGVRLAITGASEDGVYRWTEAEAALNANFAPEALDGLAVAPEGMIADVHASARYRAHLVTVAAKRAVAGA